MRDQTPTCEATWRPVHGQGSLPPSSPHAHMPVCARTWALTSAAGAPRPVHTIFSLRGRFRAQAGSGLAWFRGRPCLLYRNSRSGHGFWQEAHPTQQAEAQAAPAWYGWGSAVACLPVTGRHMSRRPALTLHARSDRDCSPLPGPCGAGCPARCGQVAVRAQAGMAAQLRQ